MSASLPDWPAGRKITMHNEEIEWHYFPTPAFPTKFFLLPKAALDKWTETPLQWKIIAKEMIPARTGILLEHETFRFKNKTDQDLTVNGMLLLASNRKDDKGWDTALLVEMDQLLPRNLDDAEHLFLLSNYYDDPRKVDAEMNEAVFLAAKIATNGFCIDGRTRHIFIGASRVNHSCTPNCDWEITYATDSGRACLRIFTTREVSPGEELTIPYTRILPDSTPRRQHELLRTRLFMCMCEACKGEKPAAHLRMLRREKQMCCPKCGREGFLGVVCETCKVAHYCKRECLEGNAEVHGKYCSQLKAQLSAME